ncbi:outer membrane beta-barrel protein [Photobacterium chitinilyticum]|uniref:Uncharacterized protein n=1 Tax=Photobacterium chitinilyticum TaxID=2485123 RepID=A0A444JT80_9GAMM|nr:outer membrane beta-barrel protein [Photobacterium chitinilyticum]RWX56342.1 hypothetical protein EDI28_08695 [Photobacterium chitinilyticum]
MDINKTAAVLLFALLPITAIAEDTEQLESPMRYFASLKGGASQLSNSDRVVLSNGNKLEAETTTNEGFAGLDIGVYTPGGRSRVYYSFEQHKSETMFKDTSAYETKANMHLLSADYLFRHENSVSPFVGLHIGYSSVESDSRFPDGFDASGIVFGLQAGVNWKVVEQFGLELGLRHSLLPTDIQTWNGADSTGNAVKFESQQNGVSSIYVGASYIF